MLWEEIIGHKQNIACIRQLIAKDRLPHALLFVGPAQIGKAKVAKVLAQELLCSETKHRPCGKCIDCTSVQEDTHPDLISIRADGQSIKIDQIRKLKHEASMGQVRASQRVAIIYDGEKMTDQAGNSLLKILEEPPANFTFIILTISIEAILPTILSRCLRLIFKPLSRQELTNVLLEKGYDKETAGIGSALSGGRFGQALLLVEENSQAERRNALILITSLRKASDVYICNKAQELDLLSTEATNKLILYIYTLVRDMMMIKVNEGFKTLIYNLDLLEELEGVARGYTINELSKIYNSIKSVEVALNGNANARLEWENFFLVHKK